MGQFQHLRRRHLIESGEFYIVQNTLEGVRAACIAVCNPLTTEDHLRELMSALRRHGKRILKDAPAET